MHSKLEGSKGSCNGLVAFGMGLSFPRRPPNIGVFL